MGQCRNKIRWTFNELDFLHAEYIRPEKIFHFVFKEMTKAHKHTYAYMSYAQSLSNTHTHGHVKEHTHILTVLDEILSIKFTDYFTHIFSVHCVYTQI